jgi:hypothetical protein
MQNEQLDSRKVDREQEPARRRQGEQGIEPALVPRRTEAEECQDEHAGVPQGAQKGYRLAEEAGVPGGLDDLARAGAAQQGPIKTHLVQQQVDGHEQADQGDQNDPAQPRLMRHLRFPVGYSPPAEISLICSSSAPYP